MTNELLLNNLHLIRLLVDKEVRAEIFGGSKLDYDTWLEVLEFQRELEKQETTGDNP